MVEQSEHPRYRDLLSREGHPPGSSWGLWGDDDEIGALNLVTAEHVVAAAQLVRRGAVFPLNWGLENPEPALFSRGPIEHVKRDDGFGMDDHFNRFFPHASSHWDSMGHFANPDHGYYMGRTSEEMKSDTPRNSIAEWAKRGVVGRFLLADVERWRRSIGRPIPQGTSEAIAIGDVEETLAAQGAEPQLGDILLLRFGWVAWYAGLDETARQAFVEGEDWDFKAPGLAPEEETLEWIWDAGIVAVASDCPAVEAFPFPPLGPCLHASLLPMLGINLGEMFDLDGLAADCESDGTYVGLFTSAPMNYTGATGSPANALALK